MKIHSCTIYLVRHGQSEANAQHIRSGNTPLTKKGEEQAYEFANTFPEGFFAALFSSSLKRAKKTAEIIAMKHKLAVITNNLLNERYSGDLEGKRFEEIKEIFEKRRQLREALDYEKLKHLSFAKGYETDAELMQRFIPALKKLAVANKEKTILVVSHSGIMRTLLVHLGFVTHKELVPMEFINTATIRLHYNKDKLSVDEVRGLVKKYI